MAENIRILLADDHPVLRSGLEALLWLEDGLQVVGQASTGEEAVEKARLLRPDVVVMDLSMPGIGGIEATKQIGELGLGARVLVLTSQAEEDVLRAYHLNANCYITKPVDLDQFMKVVKTIEDFWLTIVKLPSE